MKLLTRDVKIETASVVLDTLKVSGKQMTQSIFGQLDSKHIAEDGIIWGRVNYHPDGCKGFDEHIHFVWQKDDSLYRDSMSLTKGIKNREGWTPNEAKEPEFFFQFIRNGGTLWERPPGIHAGEQELYRFGDQEAQYFFRGYWDFHGKWRGIPAEDLVNHIGPVCPRETEIMERLEDEAYEQIGIMKENMRIWKLISNSRHLFIAA